MSAGPSRGSWSSGEREGGWVFDTPSIAHSERRFLVKDDCVELKKKLKRRVAGI